MVRLIRQCAHVRDPHIEHVFGIAGMIGQAASDIGTLLDQRDAEVGSGAMKQLIGQQHATGAAAYDDRVSASEGIHATAPQFRQRFSERAIRLARSWPNFSRWMYE